MSPTEKDVQHLQFLAAAVERTSSPIMMVDRDLVVTYANLGTRTLFEKHRATFEAAYPGFDTTRMLGTCIDIFHKHPEHQRRLLADPSRLPHKAVIRIGDLHFELHVSAVVDSAGVYAGNVLEWHDVTQRVHAEEARRRSETAAELLRQSVQAAAMPMMLVNRDLEITFVNEATVALMTKNEAVMRQVYPGFRADGLVGRNIDIFHKHPEHQRKLLADPRNLPYKTRIKVGGLVFALNVSAVMDGRGEYVGCTLQWQDVTTEVDAEQQIKDLIAQAAAGELSHRLHVVGWEGFYKVVGEGINALLSAVASPIQDARKVAGALAEGDLTVRAPADSQGEFKLLADDLNRSIDQLTDMVGRIRGAATDITQGAGEINQGNSDLSTRTQEQAAALEETASTVEELTATVRQNAANAGQARQLAGGARDLAEKGGEVVAEAVRAMDAISSSSKQIADIIGVIDEIAFQTNLLALNAAVEAARAGDQGRGFAVVASEVRNLAQRSASAAREIKTLIKDSAGKVEHGGRLVGRSGQTLQEIVASVRKVSDIVTGIASASEEQAMGIEQVNKAVAQMDQVTQQNAALVEEAAAASAAMEDHARSLVRLVDAFDTGAEAAAEAPVEAPRPVPRRAMPTLSAPRKPVAKATNGRSGGRAGFGGAAPARMANDSQDWEEF